MLLSVLNLNQVDWDSDFASVKASNAVSLIVIVFFCAVLLIYTVSYFKLPK